MLIVRNLILGPQRWSELRRDLPGVAKNLLATRLAQLEEDGVVVQTESGYQLTPRGAELEAAIFALARWGEGHCMGPSREGESMRLRYLMTSARRRLKPSELEAQVQLWVEETPFSVTLGISPTVSQGESTAAAVVRCGIPGMRALVFGEADARMLLKGGLITAEGDDAAVQAMVQAWR